MTTREPIRPLIPNVETSPEQRSPARADWILSTKPDSSHYANVDTARGLCAIMIVLSHIPWIYHFRTSALIENGWLFVDFFFVLSGFVIGVAHGASAPTYLALRRFLLKRIFRLYPLHLVTLGLMAVLLIARYAYDPRGTVVGYGINREWMGLLIANLFLAQCWGFSARTILNDPSWSISVEFVAYIAFGLVCLQLTGARRRTAAMMALSTMSLLILVIFRDASLEGDATFRLARCLYGFGIGTLSWYVCQRVPASLSTSFAVLLQPFFVILIVAMLFLVQVNGHITLLMPWLFAPLIITMAKDRRSFIRRSLELSIPVALGRLSFSIYLTHSFLLATAGAVIARMLIGYRPEGLIPLDPYLGDLLTMAMLIATITLSIATERFVERPWREKGRRLAAGLHDT